MVVDGLAIDPDVERGRVRCRDCAGGGDDGGASEGDRGEGADRRGGEASGGRDRMGAGGRGPELASGESVTVALLCYENHSWEITGVHCEDHAVATVEGAMGVRAADQAVVAAVLEAAGYRSPAGERYPDALTLGRVEVLDFSPAAAGY